MKPKQTSALVYASFIRMHLSSLAYIYRHVYNNKIYFQKHGKPIYCFNFFLLVSAFVIILSIDAFDRFTKICSFTLVLLSAFSTVAISTLH